MFVYGDFEVPSPSEEQTAQQYDPDKETVSSWVKEYISSNPWLVPISTTYINDNFNLWGLNSEIKNYSPALKMIKGVDLQLTDEERESIKEEAIKLFNLIHQRYLLTFAGVKQLQVKYLAETYGKCPRVSCHHAKLLPIGLSPHYGEEHVKLYCPCCKEVYDTLPEYEKYDGAAFGPYCPSFFQQALDCEMTFPKCQKTDLTILGIPIEPGEMNRCALLRSTQ